MAVQEDLFHFDPGYRSKLLKEFGFTEENRETIKGNYGNTGFPEPRKYYQLLYEVYDLSIEEPYFWVLHTMKEYMPIVEKLEDSFAASENSAFFGVTQQRLGAQQDKISQLLATVGKMIKELFQMVRELRIIDERMEYYEEVEKQLKKPIEQRDKGAEITLKGFFVDLVQGGGKSAASVYGMARELEFITLPDLFFDAPPLKNTEEITDHIKSIEKNFNQNVVRVLHRHLRQYIEWRRRTHEEHSSRRRFQLAYLRQHFDIIKMYINWIKPYLRHVVRLNLKERNMMSPDLISAFEGSMLDIELLARHRKVVGKVPDGKGGQKEVAGNACILATFNYRTRPELKVVQEGYQRGPVHIGRFEMHLRVYGWNDEQVERYKKLKDRENLDLMGAISTSVQQAMESLGKQLDVYLEEAQGTPKESKKKESKSDNRSFTSRFLGEFYTSSPKKDKEEATSAKQLREMDAEVQKSIDGMLKGVKSTAFNMFKTFKKAHRMVMW